MGSAARRAIGGDALSLSIAAASIVAKTTRDALMRNLAREYPRYGFADHVGYATAFHRRALAASGPAPSPSLVPVAEDAGRRLRSTSSLPIRPTTSSSKEPCRVPTRAWSTPSTMTGTNSPISPNMTPSPGPGWAPRPGDEAERHDRRDRLLSQHLPRRRDPAGGPRLLDPERHHLAQSQPDAEFPRPPLHQRP